MRRSGGRKRRSPISDEMYRHAVASIDRGGGRFKRHRAMTIEAQFVPSQDFNRGQDLESMRRIRWSNSSNWYIYPKEVLDYISRLSAHDRSLIDNDDRMDLQKLQTILNDVLRHQEFETFSRADRSSDEFVENEFRKMHADRNERADEWVFPFIENRELIIPGRDIRDLPIYLMLYILESLTRFPIVNGRYVRSFNLSYSIGDDMTDMMNNERFPLYEHETVVSSPITVVNGKIRVKDIAEIYRTLMRKFAAFLEPDGRLYVSRWTGSEDSGTRIILYNMMHNGNIHLKLYLNRAHVNGFGSAWTQEMENLLQQTVGGCVISVRNHDDNKCLLYCIVIGLIMKMKEGGRRTFGTSTLMVETSEVYCKGMFLYQDEDAITKLIHGLTRLLLPPIYSHGEVPDPLIRLVEDLDKKVGTMMSITEFGEVFKDIEEKLIPQKECGLDVYGMDFNVNKHIYPLYISQRNRDHVIELLCVTPQDFKCSHFCLITNMEKLLRESGGKQFVSCSKCGQCFYHRRLLKEHECTANANPTQVNGDGGYHYSSKNVDPRCDIVHDSCSKCRLCFTDEFTANYHKEHCLMQGQTGYRHVQLVTYNTEEHPMLRGEAIDMEAEEKHVKQRRVMYADFESSIDPETGEHTFMSFGLYEWETGVYICGYSIHEFLEVILRIAYSFDEDQIYIYFHNAMGYDSNFILRHVLKTPEFQDWGIQVIMKSSNRLQKLVFHTHQGDKSRMIHIGDTFLFLTLSLERIVDSIRKDDLEMNKTNFSHFFDVFHKRYPFASDMEIDHILRKNIFPYKFFTSSRKLQTRQSEFLSIFEPREENLQYFSERVTLDDLNNSYLDTKHVMEIFKCENAKDYHDLYLCCDVMQLADVFDRSMKILWESHHIHLTKYIGMPSASWAAFLRYDPTMEIPLYENTFFAEFFKGMIRGGITSAALRHAVADERHSIIYLDVNGLYPYVMQRYDFPCGEMHFMPLGWVGELCKIKLEEYFAMFEREHKGMCFCVDMEIPDSVKELTDMYPFAPEHRRIFNEYYEDMETKEMTPFLKRWSEANEGETMPEFTGLVCTLYDKVKYNVHWRLLKFYMEHGVIIKKVWFGVMFDEGDYLAGYIRKNIEIRNTRKDELGKTLYKLLGNSIYGKTFESPFKRNTYVIVRDHVKLQGLLEEGNIAAMTPIDDLGWIVRMDGEDIILDKPTYIGACVCEFAKLHMYTLLYDKLMSIFPNGADGEKGCQLVYTDTDSFIVRVLHPEGVGSSCDELFSYIKSKDPTLIGGIGGQVKSETGEDDTIQEVIALRSKVYAYITKNGYIGKRAKGTTHDAQEMQLDWETYKRALESLTSINTRNVQFVRKTFKIASLDVFRQSLSVNDGKRYICDDGIHTHAFGYIH